MRIPSQVHARKKKKKNPRVIAGVGAEEDSRGKERWGQGPGGAVVLLLWFRSSYIPAPSLFPVCRVGN